VILTQRQNSERYRYGECGREKREGEREREKKNNRGKEREKGMIHTLLLLQSVCKTKVLPHLKLAPYCRVTDNKRTRLSTNQ